MKAQISPQKHQHSIIGHVLDFTISAIEIESEHPKSSLRVVAAKSSIATEGKRLELNDCIPAILADALTQRQTADALNAS